LITEEVAKARDQKWQKIPPYPTPLPKKENRQFLAIGVTPNYFAQKRKKKKEGNYKEITYYPKNNPRNENLGLGENFHWLIFYTNFHHQRLGFNSLPRGGIAIVTTHNKYPFYFY
jgi:hypothetical protein